jgi:hypothetical protein
LKTHRYFHGDKNGFGISPMMQELITCYGRCNEVLSHFLPVTVSSTQVYRVTGAVSESLKEEERQADRTLPPVAKGEVLYAGVDGSMTSTREEGWKEVKLARLFKSSDCLNPNTASSYLTQSQYVAHLGSSKDFCEKAEQVIDRYGQLKERLVFLTNGVSWIKKWIEDSYSDPIAILDYFHTCEHLHEFAENCFKKDIDLRGKWFTEQKSLLYESEVEKVMENISETSAAKSDKEKLINYYQNNRGRMNYKKYRLIGCGIIGSGSIESAHRTVIQKRMKLSGQHWSKAGSKNMLRLRVITMNKQWYKVIKVIKNPKPKAA